MLAKLASDQVVVLSFHVDYWDKLGWKDPHSTAMATQRQSDYAASFKSNRVYTPQMIVNGTSEFVGSNEARATAEITATLKQTHAAKLRLELGKSEAESLSFRYEAKGIRHGDTLNLALVQKQFTSKVLSGENAGKTLEHMNSVIGFRTLELDKSTSGELKLLLPQQLKPNELLLIGYLQNTLTGQIIAVSQLQMSIEFMAR